MAGPPVWHRLHPLSPVIRAGRALAGIIVVYGATLFNSARTGRGGLYTHLTGAVVLVVLGVVSWLVTRWCVQDGVLRIETGLIRRQSLRFPLTQLQAIDTVRPGLARIFGLAELRLRMGGSDGSAGRLAYLRAPQAEALRTQLLALGQGVSTPQEVTSETELVSVPTGRLIASILLSRSVTLVLLAIVALAVTAYLAPAAAIAVIGSSGAASLGVATMLWRRFNGAYRLTVTTAGDGLHLRSGLIATAAETIPSGRVQAVRMVEPLLWRPFGWCRMEIDVAGRQRRHSENSPEGRELRSVLPVGTRDQASRLLALLLPDAPPDREPPPSRARLKSPLRFHNLSWGRTETCAVSTTGRVARITSWVPLTKVQSLRLVQGPLQRRLRLATIHLDTAGRTVHAALSDRDAGESARLLQELTIQCRSARRGPARVPPGALTTA